MADDGDLPNGGDGNQDICTYFATFINQRLRVEQLLNWLRESQTACTDTNCFDDINGMPGTELGGGSLATDHGDDSYESDFENGPFAIVLCLIFGLLTMYAMTLNANRRAEESALPNKSSTSANGNPNNTDDHGPHRRRNNEDDDHGRPTL